MQYKQKISAYLDMLKNVIDLLDIDEIERTMNAIREQRVSGNPIFIFGNGGSASTASHFACDFNKGASEHLEQGFKFICLNDNIATLTAIANDMSYEDVFYFQLAKQLKKQDMIIAISASGNSQNVIKAVQYARTIGCKIIALTGYQGGRLKSLADYNLHVPVDDMQKVEDMHLMFDHLMMQIFCETDQ